MVGSSLAHSLGTSIIRDHALVWLVVDSVLNKSGALRRMVGDRDLVVMLVVLTTSSLVSVLRCQIDEGLNLIISSLNQVSLLLEISES